MTPPLISVIVLNYNGRPWLRPCLDALAAQTGAPPFEVIVVDNASPDGSADIVREYIGTDGRPPRSAGAFNSVRLVEAGGNLGFAAGNNVGARRAHGRLLVFLNNDTVADADWLAQLHAALIDRPEFAIVASRLVFIDDPATVDSGGDGYFRAGGAFKRGYGGPAADMLQSREVFGACGAAFLIRRALYEALGGFDESFFMVYEDVDLSYRARLLGHRCWYAATAVVRHAGSATLGRVSTTAVFHGQRNLEWTWIKNTPWPLFWRTAASHVLYSAAGVLHYLRVGMLGAAVRGKIAALGGLPAALRARRDIQSRRVADPSPLMDSRWLAAKRREKRASIP